MKKLFSILLAICLIAGLLPVVASAAAANITFHHDTGTTLANVEEGQTVYFVTAEDGKVHNNGNVASDSNYNVKVDYTGDVPTIYLKGATLNGVKGALSVSGSGGAESYIIEVEEDSEITTAAGSSISVSNANLTITGPGKLTINSEKGNAINVSDSMVTSANPAPRFDLVLEEANLEVNLDNSEHNSYTPGIGNHTNEIYIVGGNIKVNSNTVAAFYSINGGITISDSAELDITVESQSAFSTFKRFTMESGHLKMRIEGAAALGLSSAESIAFTGGTVDFAGSAFAYYPKDPSPFDFSGYEDEHTVVVCQSKDGKGAEPYEDQDLSLMNYFQLTKGSSYEVTVKNGTTDLSVANKGDTVTITARIAPEGKVFDKWEVNTGAVTLANPTATSTTFTMPGENVKITATYKSVETEEEPTPEASTPEASTPEESTPEVSTPEASTPDESTPDNTEHTDEGNNEGNKNTGKKKANVTNVLLIVIIVILVLGIGAGAAFIVIRVKKLNAGEETADDAEAPAEEATEDAETPAEDAE